MADSIDNLEFRSGDTLKAADLQRLVDAIRDPVAIARGGDGIDVRRGARGQLQITAHSERPILIRITVNGDTNNPPRHEWKQVIWNYQFGSYIDSSVTGTVDNGDPAYEISSLRCPKGDDVIVAWRSEMGPLVFEARPQEGITSAAFTTGTLTVMQSGPVLLYTPQGGAIASSSLTVTAYSRWGTAIGNSKGVGVRPWAGKWLIWPGEC